MAKYTLSCIVPIYNEQATLKTLVMKLVKLSSSISLEIILVNDGSTDNSTQIIKNLHTLHPQIILVDIKENKGKGYAIAKGLEKAVGTYVLVQDADLEYNPKDIPNLLAAIKNRKKVVVYGSRNIVQKNYLYPHYYYGGVVLTKIFNILFGQQLTDIFTGYKLFRTSDLKALNLQQEKFEFCVEVTVKAINRGLEIIEVPISYQPRSFLEGKKIKFINGLKALYLLISYRIQLWAGNKI